MIGTAKEILLWLASDTRNAKLLNMSRQRLVCFRTWLKQDSISEERMEEYIKNLKKNSDKIRMGSDGGLSCGLYSAICLRKKYILPAVVCDHRGRLFHETALVKACMSKPGYEDLNLSKVVNVMGREGCLPSEQIVRELLRRKGWNMVEPRHILPSVWCVE